MKKEFWKSMTFYGSVLVAIGLYMKTGDYGEILNVIGNIFAAFGTGTAAFGIRRALK